MFAYKIKRIVIILFMFSLDVFVLSHYNIELNKQTNEEGHVNKYFAQILKSLVKLNEKRVGNLKKLYLLNNYHFGEEPLRSYINNDEDYDNLIKSIKVILKELNNNENGVPNHPLNLYRTHNLNVKKKKQQNIDRILRELTEDSQSDTSSNRQKSDEVRQNISKEKTNEGDNNVSELTSEVEGNGKNESLRYYYYYYTCNDSESRCRRSCKAAYRYVCEDSSCSDRFRREMRRACNKACSKWFDD